jgi:23S rRNA (cytosine1962-C5)-methyltransferase
LIAGDVVVNRKGEARIRRGHPWVFRTDVVAAEESIEPGALVRVLSSRHAPLGFALFSTLSEITLRLIARGSVLPDDFLERRIDEALRLRDVVAAGCQASRLVHGEGDGLPSLIVDRYTDVLVVQTLSQGMERLKSEVVRVLVERLAPRGILERNDPRVRQLEGLPSNVGVLWGDVPKTVEVEEGGMRLTVDPWAGQKTGLFLDQRENHLAARAYARGRALDAFTYNGGFALQMAAAGGEVLAVDSSPAALDRTGANAARNGLASVTTREANVFDLLRELEHHGEHFDTVVLDPPAFAKSRAAVAKAQRGYKEINLRAMKLLTRGGVLVSCSCSHHIHETDFEAILSAAAADAGVVLTIVEKRRQARDHPVVLGVPETHYLKCFVLRRLE